MNDPIDRLGRALDHLPDALDHERNWTDLMSRIDSPDPAHTPFDPVPLHSSGPTPTRRPRRWVPVAVAAGGVLAVGAVGGIVLAQRSADDAAPPVAATSQSPVVPEDETSDGTSATPQVITAAYVMDRTAKAIDTDDMILKSVTPVAGGTSTDLMTTDGTLSYYSWAPEGKKANSEMGVTVDAEGKAHYTIVDHTLSIWWQRVDDPAAEAREMNADPNVTHEWTAEDLDQAASNRKAIADLVELVRIAQDSTRADSVDLVGTETLGGKDVQHVRIVNPDNQLGDGYLEKIALGMKKTGRVTIDLWVDTATWLPARNVMTLEVCDTDKAVSADDAKASQDTCEPLSEYYGKSTTTTAGGAASENVTTYTWLPDTKAERAKLIPVAPAGYEKVTQDEANDRIMAAHAGEPGVG